MQKLALILVIAVPADILIDVLYYYHFISIHCSDYKIRHVNFIVPIDINEWLEHVFANIKKTQKILKWPHEIPSHLTVSVQNLIFMLYPLIFMHDLIGNVTNKM